MASRSDCSHLAPARLAPVAPVRRLWTVLLITGGFMVVEAVGGWISGSLALLADAGHMLTDVGALALTLFTARMARRPPNDSKTFGYLRLEILAALVNGAVLFGIAALIIVEAIGRIGGPRPIQGELFLGVALAGLLVNAAGLVMLHQDREHNLNTRGAYLHILGDLLGSVGAIVAAVVVLVTGWTPVDPIISVVIALLILGGAWRLVRESADILLEAVPAHVSMAEVEHQMLGVQGVAAVHDLHVWTVTSGMVAMSGHAVVPDLANHPDVLTRIREVMCRLGIGHVTVQLEVGGRCEAGGREGGRAGTREGGMAQDKTAIV